MRKIIIITILSLLLSNSLLAQKKDNNVVNWISFEQLSDSLDTNPKKVLLFFHTEWCTYCKKMMKEAFTDNAIVDKINNDYYAVHFDAESVEPLLFDNIMLRNTSAKKKKGDFHQIVTLLLPDNQVLFPSIITLDSSFKMLKKKQKYLSIKELLKFL